VALFTVDPKKCKRDGLCIAVCPGLLIEITGEEGFPSPLPDADNLCINCGHCVSVCPHGAISLATMAPKDCLPIRKELAISTAQGEQFLKSRRSIRSFKKKPVPRDLLIKAIEIARYAPTGGNSQPVRWLVIEDTKEVKRLTGLVVDYERTLFHDDTEPFLRKRMERNVRAWENGIDRVCRNAPHVIVAHGSTALPASQSSCIIALAYLELAAIALGLGTCWAGYFNTAANSYPPLLETLALPKDHLPYGAMMIGYPKYPYQRIPLRDKPKITWR
jgi:nitroreductase/NAD-dependent dihydropyrimidine dehydrogenase PreA subunit